MTGLLYALGATAASAGVMYLTCLRPMLRKGNRAPQADQELARLRREVAELRDHPTAGQPPDQSVASRA
jgi:hypothetical protein